MIKEYNIKYIYIQTLSTRVSLINYPSNGDTFTSVPLPTPPRSTDIFPFSNNQLFVHQSTGWLLVVLKKRLLHGVVEIN